MINEEALRTYLLRKFSHVSRIDIRKLGSGVQGAGFLVELKAASSVRSFVVKTLVPEGLGHDYPSDRAAVFLLDLDEYNALPGHVKAIDVLSEMHDGSIRSIGGGKEYYLLTERADGDSYFMDLAELSRKDALEGTDIRKIQAMASYLARIHSVRKDSKTLYWRKLRDTVGHGECLMGVFDTYPDGILSYEEMGDIVKKSVDWIMKLKPRYGRLCQIHGDFHPGNIWFQRRAGEGDFILLDRSRGPWGEAADDVTALTINYIFFSIRHHGTVKCPYMDALTLFFDQYIKASGDPEITEVVAPFFAFRGAVVANPVFYPELNPEQRRTIFWFVHNVLDDDMFRFERVNDYLG